MHLLTSHKANTEHKFLAVVQSASELDAERQRAQDLEEDVELQKRAVSDASAAVALHQEEVEELRQFIGQHAQRLSRETRRSFRAITTHSLDDRMAALQPQGAGAAQLDLHAAWLFDAPRCCLWVPDIL